MDIKNLQDLDLYELLGVSPSCTESEIKKAYRKRALQCHPDKNPDNPNAAKEFQQLSAILEILTDEAARRAYDKVLKARKEAELRKNELDGKRRKLREDLERRERAGLGGMRQKQKSPEEVLKEEIERLRKEGSKAVEEEMEYVIQQLRSEAIRKDNDGSKCRIKVKWTCDRKDASNGGYTEEMLMRFLSKYGDISALVISAKKKGSALVEFKTRNAAEMAVQLEIGLPENPLKLEFVDKDNNQRPSNNYQSSTIKETDFESVVLMKMRQAEERKKLIEQMMKEDEGT